MFSCFVQADKASAGSIYKQHISLSASLLFSDPYWMKIKILVLGLDKNYSSIQTNYWNINKSWSFYLSNLVLSLTVWYKTT